MSVQLAPCLLEVSDRRLMYCISTVQSPVGQEIKMIRKCKESDFNTIFEIINDAAQAYKGVIPEDRWNEPYMPFEELRKESAGLRQSRFSGLRRGAA